MASSSSSSSAAATSLLTRTLNSPSSYRGLILLTVGAAIIGKSGNFENVEDDHDDDIHNCVIRSRRDRCAAGTSTTGSTYNCGSLRGWSSSSLSSSSLSSSQTDYLRTLSLIRRATSAATTTARNSTTIEKSLHLDGTNSNSSTIAAIHPELDVDHHNKNKNNDSKDNLSLLLDQLWQRLREMIRMISLNNSDMSRTLCDDYVKLHRMMSKGLESIDDISEGEYSSGVGGGSGGGEGIHVEAMAEHVSGHHHHPSQQCDELDIYPNFSRHGTNALLPQYLTPEVFERLRWKQTPSGVTLEDVIRSGVALPGGADPPRGLAGVYAGDADSYRVFHALFDPLIKDYHHHQSVKKRQPQQENQRRTTRKLQRHQTDLNYNLLLHDTLDPEGDYILYTRMRLARSISGFRFAPCIRRGERQEVETLVKDCVKDWPGGYVSVMQMTNTQHENLIQQHILFNDPDDFMISAGFGRDWPDGRGIYCDTWQDTPAIIIWCNAEDHLWLISHGKGGNVQGVFTKLSKAVNALESALKERDRSFVEDRKYGFLNTSPANIGTALRASVYVKLVRLSRHPGFFDLIDRLRLEARSSYSQSDKRFTGIFDIANAEALGKSEVDLINIMIRGVGFLIELEKKLERGEHVDLNSIAVPEIYPK